MIADKICRYLSRLDGVEVANTNESGSRYFNAPGVKIRVSDHLAFSYNPTTTLNIICDIKTDTFVVFYGSRIMAIKNYNKLKELLRNFVMVCDTLAPLANIRNKSKVIERKVIVEKPVIAPPSHGDSNWIWVGDLDDSHKAGCLRNVENIRKMVTTRPKPNKKKGK